MATPEQVGRLPKWAQEERATMQREIATLAQRVADLSATSDASSPIQWTTMMETPQPLPAVALIEFLVGERGKAREKTIAVNLTREGTALRVAGTKTIVVEPSASNSVIIHLRD